MPVLRLPIRASGVDDNDGFFNVMAAERSFIAIKPDGVQRGLVGEILGRFERKGFKLVGSEAAHPNP